MTDAWNLDFRPESYWTGPHGGGPSVNERLGRPDAPPGFDGRGYLPDPEDDEVDIASLLFQTIGGDVIRIRAKSISDGLLIRVIDETDMEFIVPRPVWSRPLSLGELIGVIDETRCEDMTGLFDAELDGTMPAGEDHEVLRGFLTVTSAFYPQLEAFYEQRFDEWAARKRVAG